MPETGPGLALPLRETSRRLRHSDFGSLDIVSDFDIRISDWVSAGVSQRANWATWVLAGAIMLSACFLLRAPAQAAETVAAKVGDQTICVRDVDRLVAVTTRGQQVHPQSLPLVRAQVLEELIERRLVLAYARRMKDAPAQEEIDRSWAALTKQLAARHQSLDDYLKAQAAGEADVRRQLAWNLVWEKYTRRYITDARLETYFNAHRRQFDGSRLSVRHILLRPKDGDPSPDIGALLRRAQQIRREILAGELSFADAARKYSSGPSAADGGLLGFIPRRGVMDESFSRAAFELDAGQLSQPVRSGFGVHLILCDEIRPGTKTWSEVREELEEALARELLHKLADAERRHTAVEYTGTSPHFKPGTRELVVP